ncbi:hypothetical protein FUAX_55540 (plasmid) [Fulvitalea axinellae]|uniref:TIGR02646 family protein n=1 Tax=Fulvitalea axinellae TaxID=1182444 RepID=A0AAU9CZE3_9BACT|nr:hypothetical protein FUAX_55540 [Fulvitalea axinellae]
MKKVSKNFDDVPRGLETKKCKVLINQALTENNDHDFKKYYYAHTSVKDALKSIYNNKCAYCESDISVGSPLRVDHYRPKDKVRDCWLEEEDKELDGQKLKRTKKIVSNGYYWLGYEWSNLVYSCESCNGSKSNYFPLKDEEKRIKHPPLRNEKLDKKKCHAHLSPLAEEPRLLLNPELDNPRDHLLCFPDGEVGYYTGEGEMSVKVYDLNRDPLRVKRKECYEKVFDKLARRLERFDREEYSERTVITSLEDILMEDLLSVIQDNGPYYSFFESMILDFDLYFVERFSDPEHKRLLKLAYDSLINSIA